MFWEIRDADEVFAGQESRNVNDRTSNFVNKLKDQIDADPNNALGHTVLIISKFLA